MTIHQTIKQHIKEAMIARDERRLTALRGVHAEIQKDLISKNLPGPEADDAEALAALKRLVKQRKDSIQQFTEGNRPDLATLEAEELKILEVYLPASMPKEEIRRVAAAKAAELGVTDKSGAGKLIGAIARELKGKAEGSDIKEVVDSLFA